MTTTDALTEAEKSILWTWCNCAHGEAESEAIREGIAQTDDEAFDAIVTLSERAQRIYGQSFPRYSEAF